MYLLCEKHSWCEVMSKSENFRNLIIPIQKLGIDVQKVAASERAAWRMKNVERLMNQLAKFTKAFVDRSNVGRLLTRPLQWGACAVVNIGNHESSSREPTIVSVRNPQGCFNVRHDGRLWWQLWETRALWQGACGQGPRTVMTVSDGPASRRVKVRDSLIQREGTPESGRLDGHLVGISRVVTYSVQAHFYSQSYALASIVPTL